jgi:hypothetical protein
MMKQEMRPTEYGDLPSPLSGYVYGPHRVITDSKGNVTVVPLKAPLTWMQRLRMRALAAMLRRHRSKGPAS